MKSKTSRTTTPNTASPGSASARLSPQQFAIDSRQIQRCQQQSQQ